MKKDRLFEIRTIVIDKWNTPNLLVLMDLETYNEALTTYKEHLQDDFFNMGFVAGQDPYPTEEELADMDADRTENDSQKDNS